MGRELLAITLSNVCDGRREALTGNYLEARVDRAIPENTLVRAVARREEGNMLILEKAEPIC